MIGRESTLDADTIKHSTPIHSRRRSHDKKKSPLFGNDENTDHTTKGRDLCRKPSLERQNNTNSQTPLRRDTLESSGSFIEDLRRRKKEEEGLLKEKENENSKTIFPLHLQQQPLTRMDSLTLDDIDPVATEIIPSIKKKGIATAVTTNAHNSAKCHGSDVTNRTTLLTLIQTSPAMDRSAKYHDSATPITLETAVDLKTLIFGSAKLCFSVEWRRQGFYFSAHQGLEYGLVQEKGGPCGLLASVQAWVLCYLLKSSKTSKFMIKIRLNFLFLFVFIVLFFTNVFVS